MGKFARTLLAGIAFSAATALAQGIAFVSDIRGDVSVDGNPRPLLLSELVKGQKITVGRDSQLWVMYIATGKEYLLKVPGDYHVKDTEVASDIGVPPIARTTDWRASNKVLTHVAQAARAGARVRSVAKPGPGAAPGLLYPTQGRVASLQPQFRWRGSSEESADLMVLTAGQERPVHSARSVASGYRLPARLKPDAEYTWTVSVSGQSLGTGTFRTLSADALQQADKQRPSHRAGFSDRVLYALYLQELGAVQEAQEWWSRLAHERADLPELSALAR